MNPALPTIGCFLALFGQAIAQQGPGGKIPRPPVVQPDVTTPLEVVQKEIAPGIWLEPSPPDT